MSVFAIWILIIIAVSISRIKKAAEISQSAREKGSNTPVRPTTARNTPVRPTTAGNTPVRSQQRSFAAMSQQERAIPNVERDCIADDKHRFENNLSGYNKKKSTAIPNVQSKRMRPQPKKSGNRKVARQLYIGDVVPQGMRVVECGYCAADNLVPYGARNEYKCYFCHYDI